jgi:hypothetical protein
MNDLSNMHDRPQMLYGNIYKIIIHKKIEPQEACMYIKNYMKKS